ncbi:ATP-dependent zinc metalloprotease FtsH [Candidatus Nomurabacteria bacterium]|nr:ATP-dependent zinc metalloprotease FtsH [Candidatus Nomurabacteria bacterium]
MDFLKSPKKFLDIGARIPKGVILTGAPGTGKTLLARAVAGEASVPFFHLSGSEFVEMFVGVGASVTGDTPVLIKTEGGAKLMPIKEIVDRYYKDGEFNHVKYVDGMETLGFKTLNSGFRGENSKEKKMFGGSQWSKVSGVLRHKADSVYKIRYRGGEIKTTGDHSIFVREKNMIVKKKTSELKSGDILVNLPFKVRSSFMSGFGTIHKIRAHEFIQEQKKYLDLYGAEQKKIKSDYAYALSSRGIVSQAKIAECVGVSQATVGNWQSGEHMPQFLTNNLIKADAPEKIEITPDVMRLLGYYTAEGRATEYYTQFVFGIAEKDLHTDCIKLIKNIFHLEPQTEDVVETNSFRITISSPIVSRFFEKYAGTGSHNKHIPEFIWDLPKEYFLAYLFGYSEGDGYTTKDGKLSVTSVSKKLITELAWLSSMHGFGVGMRQTKTPARIIRKGGKMTPESISWNLIIGKSSHPFVEYAGSANQFKKPIVESVEKETYEGYVYDLCGCDNEAFFGGEKPILLHNSRVRDLFKMAKKAAPAIIFVDEIDAIGRTRGGGFGGGNDEREQTLNQILVEMDGFEPNDKVIVMAATNRPDVLDPALIRPGRFDRKVLLDLPDRADREEILQIHAAKKPLAEDINLKLIAERTPGFSGADLYSLMNEGAILAARENRKKVFQFDLIRAIEKVMLGPERKSHLLSKKEKEITAYHEAGHALVASVLPYADPVHKVSIIARGNAGGYTLKLPLEEKRLQSKKEFIDDIAMSLGGYVAEQMIFGDITTGPSSDLQVAANLARAMVTRWGMSDVIGPIALVGGGGRPQYGEIIEKEYSETVSTKVDAEVSRIINDGIKSAEKVLLEHRKAFDAIAHKLIEVETLEQEEYEKILTAHGIVLKKKELIITPLASTTV